MEHSGFRKGLPAGFTDPSSDREGLRRTFRILVAQFSDTASLDEALDSVIEEFVLSRRPVMHRHLQQILHIGKLDCTTVVRATPGVLYRLADEGDTVCITCEGRDIRMPAYARRTLEHMLEGSAVSVEELRGELDDAGRLTLARRLVREGLLEVLNG